MGNLKKKKKLPKHIFFQINKKEKNPPKRERERERVITVFLYERYGLNKINDIEFI